MEEAPLVPRIALCLVAYREVMPQTVRCLLRDLRMKPEVQFVWSGNDALIDRTRSILATSFYNNDTLFDSPGAPLDVMVMVDHDVSWEEGDIERIARTAYENGAVVAGVYPKRGFSTRLPIRTLHTGQSYNVPSDVILECQYVSAGFMAIPRSVLTKVIETNKAMLPTIAGYIPFFLPMVVVHEDGAREPLSEDWSLCYRARQAGCSVLADLNPVLCHTGEYAFRVIDSICLPPTDDVVSIKERAPQ